MEYAAGGELFNYIVDKQRLSEAEAAWFLLQILEGVEHIHKNYVCHRDLKPENLLLDNHNRLKIIDFGLSNSFESNALLSSSCGSPCYASPEMIKGKKYDGQQIDCWSIGIITYAMVCGFLPFEDPDNDQLYKKILECDLEFPKNLSENAVDLIVNILNKNPKKRLTLKEIRKHPFMALGKGFRKQTVDSKNEIEMKSVVIAKMIEIGYSAEEIEKGLGFGNFDQLNTVEKLLEQKYLREGITFDFNQIKRNGQEDKHQYKLPEQRRMREHQHRQWI